MLSCAACVLITWCLSGSQNRLWLNKKVSSWNTIPMRKADAPYRSVWSLSTGSRKSPVCSLDLLSWYYIINLLNMCRVYAWHLSNLNVWFRRSLPWSVCDISLCCTRGNCGLLLIANLPNSPQKDVVISFLSLLLSLCLTASVGCVSKPWQNRRC